MAQKIPYWKSNRFLGAFVRKEGDDGCVVCKDERIRLSLDRPPPPLRDQPPKPKPVVEKKKKDDDEFLMNVIGGIHKVVDTRRRFSAWLDRPTVPEPVKKLEAAASKRMTDAVCFDLQDIPGTINKLGMPKAAAMFDKWFAGELNYSPNEEDSRLELNQHGLPYSEAMIDKKSISLDWVLGFSRAKTAFDVLRRNDNLVTPKSIKVLKKIFNEHAGKYEVRTDVECKGDIQLIHKDFQFQLATVEGSWGQKIDQFMMREVLFRGIPDELTLILGSFNLYAAISRMVFGNDVDGRFGLVTHIYIYAKDGFTFTDGDREASQYLGHWNKKSIAVVPLQEALLVTTKKGWIDHPVFQDPLRGDFSILYPVKNSDFRAWQLAHKQGGDFIIYTDKIGVGLAQPIKVYL